MSLFHSNYVCGLLCCKVTIYGEPSFWYNLENWNGEKTLPPNSEEAVTFACVWSFQNTLKFHERSWGRRDSQQNVSAKMHLVPVIQLENRNRKTTLPPNSEEAVALTGVRRFQNTSKFHEQSWGRWDSQQNVSANMHLVPGIQLENRNRKKTSPPNSEDAIAIAWVRRFQNTSKFHEQSWGRRDSQQNVMANMHLVPGFQLENRNRENTSPPNSEEAVTITWVRRFQNTSKFHEWSWGLRDSQQNVLTKMHLVPVIQLANRNREKTSPPNSEEAVAFAWVQSFQNTLKFEEHTKGGWHSQQNVLAKMDQANQAAAFRFLRGGFAVASWLLQFNTLHSSLAIASPVFASQMFHHLSSPPSSDEDDNMLAV